ncbi:MAG TPA: 3'-5' exonuclease, partial [Gammaproteobacteria bacterium]|nr:3'-5' exonuclease [Gammaproteobacteria bacterium]
KLQQYVSQLYATSDHKLDDSLQIMTIHNSKGLEFDAVILPHLEKKSPSDDKQLLLWMERPDHEFVLAPIHSIQDEKDSIYAYIKQQHVTKSDYESGRLLYVAATRAKRELHLFFSLPAENREPESSSLLKKLMPSIKNSMQYQRSENTITEEVTLQKKFNFRLTQNWRNPIQDVQEKFAFHQKNEGFLLRDHDAKNLGIVTHLILQQIAERGEAWWQTQTQEKYIMHHLLALQTLPHRLQNISAQIIQSIQYSLDDPRGKWILHASTDAQSELRITTHFDHQTHMIVIDRTFIDADGVRWIIDYKTSHPENICLDDFLQSEKEKYLDKMQLYAHALKALDDRPIKMGLYFPLVPAWVEIS